MDAELLRAAIESVIGAPDRIDFPEHDYWCPFCKRAGYSEPSHLHVNYQRSLALCHKCGWATRDLRNLVLALTGSLPRNLLQLRAGEDLEDAVRSALDAGMASAEQREEAAIMPAMPEGFVPLTRKPKDSVGRAVLDYLTGEGEGPVGRRREVPWERLVEIGAGYCVDGRLRGYAVFPVYVGGTFVTYTSRRVVGLGPKTRHSPGIGASLALFNYDHLDGCRRIFVGEGPFDAWAWHRRLHQRHGGTSILGTRLHDAQARLLARIEGLEEIIVCLDADAHAKTLKTAAKFAALTPVKVSYILIDGADPDELPIEELKSMYTNRVVYDSLQTEMIRLLGE